MTWWISVFLTWILLLQKVLKYVWSFFRQVGVDSWWLHTYRTTGAHALAWWGGRHHAMSPWRARGQNNIQYPRSSLCKLLYWQICMVINQRDAYLSCHQRCWMLTVICGRLRPQIVKISIRIRRLIRLWLSWWVLFDHSVGGICVFWNLQCGGGGGKRQMFK